MESPPVPAHQPPPSPAGGTRRPRACGFLPDHGSWGSAAGIVGPTGLREQEEHPSCSRRLGRLFCLPGRRASSEVVAFSGRRLPTRAAPSASEVVAFLAAGFLRAAALPPGRGLLGRRLLRAAVFLRVVACLLGRRLPAGRRLPPGRGLLGRRLPAGCRLPPGRGSPGRRLPAGCRPPPGRGLLGRRLPAGRRLPPGRGLLGRRLSCGPPSSSGSWPTCAWRSCSCSVYAGIAITLALRGHRAHSYHREAVGCPASFRGAGETGGHATRLSRHATAKDGGRRGRILSSAPRPLLPATDPLQPGVRVGHGRAYTWRSPGVKQLEAVPYWRLDGGWTDVGLGIEVSSEEFRANEGRG